jgi:hypothetical protein
MDQKDKLLKSFMREFFPFTEFKQTGFFTKEMKGDYKAQAQRVCTFFGYKTVYEYGAKEIRCHLTEGEDAPKGKSFVTVIENIYES